MTTDNTDIVIEPRSGYDLLTIRSGVLRWVPHTRLGPDGTDQVDGYLIADHSWDDWPAAPYRSLDLWAADAAGTADLRDEVPNVSELAAAAWSRGEVYVTDTGFSAVIPGEWLTPELMADAVARFRP